MSEQDELISAGVDYTHFVTYWQLGNGIHADEDWSGHVEDRRVTADWLL